MSDVSILFKALPAISWADGSVEAAGAAVGATFDAGAEAGAASLLR